MLLASWLSLSSLSEFVGDSSIYSNLKFPVHFSMKQIDLPFFGYDTYPGIFGFDMVMA